jgi:outer membrane protein assembly factor BamB
MKKHVVRVTAVMIAVAIVALCLAGCTAGKYDWPRWRGPNGDNISKEKGWNPKAPEGGPRIAWKVDVGGGYSNVAIQNNRVYTMGWDVAGGASVACYCLDASTGKEIWRHSSPGLHAPQATPTVDGSTVYCLSYDGVLSALDAESGKLRWEKNLAAEYGAVQPYYGFAGSPVIVGNVLILTANTSGIALDKRTGEKIWVSESPPKTAHFSDSNGTEYHTPVVYSKKGRRYVIVSSWKGVFSVEAETGKPLLLFDWKDSYATLGAQVADPLVFGEKVLIVGGKADYPGSFCLDVQDKETKILWKNEDTFSQLGSPVFFNGYLYVSQGGDKRADG